MLDIHGMSPSPDVKGLISLERMSEAASVSTLVAGWTCERQAKLNMISRRSFGLRYRYSQFPISRKLRFCWHVRMIWYICKSYIIEIVCVHDGRFIFWILAQCRPCVEDITGFLLAREHSCTRRVSLRYRYGIVWGLARIWKERNNSKLRTNMNEPSVFQNIARYRVWWFTISLSIVLDPLSRQKSASQEDSCNYTFAGFSCTTLSIMQRYVLLPY